MRSRTMLGPLALIAFGLFSFVAVLEVFRDTPPSLRFRPLAKQAGKESKLRLVSSRELRDRRQRQRHPW